MHVGLIEIFVGVWEIIRSVNNRNPYLKRTAKKKATTGRTFDIADEDVAEA